MKTPLKIWLAPMEGVVDFIMRDTITAIGGLDACVTEFMRVTDQLLPNHVFYRYAPELLPEHSNKLLSHTRAGTPVYFQLLGGQPNPVADNAARAVSLGAVGIDLNFGCPAKTVNRHDGGAALLKDPTRVYDVVKAVRASVPTTHTVSAKLRLGFENKDLYLENACAAEEAGASYITVHARTKLEMYRPPAHWEYVARIRERVQIPVIANGDIWTPEDAVRCIDVTGCHQIMVGRGLIARPSLALEIQMLFSEKQAVSEKLSWCEIKKRLKVFFEISVATHGLSFGLARIKQWTKLLCRTYPEAVDFFESIKERQDSASVLAAMKDTLQNTRITDHDATKVETTFA